jgi:GntR family transcriptional regulator
MLFTVSTDSPVPLFEQIVAHVTFAVAAGAYEPGSRIPSVRDLAQQLLVHPNTVAKAFQLLEERGVVMPRRGLGMEVTADGPDLCRSQRRRIIRSRIRQALRDAVASQLPADEVRRLVEEELRHASHASRANGRYSGEKEKV